LHLTALWQVYKYRPAQYGRSRAYVFHVHATERFLNQLTIQAEKHAEPEICDHFHAYKRWTWIDAVWYDAFDLPLLVDESIAEEKLKSFCQVLGTQYTQWHAPK